LYKDTSIIISFTLFWNLIEDEYSPNMRFIEENAVSAIHHFPYILFSSSTLAEPLTENRLLYFSIYYFFVT